MGPATILRSGGQKHSFLCPHSLVYSFDSGHFQTAAVEVELSRWVHGQGWLNDLGSEGRRVDTGMGTGEYDRLASDFCRPCSQPRRGF